MRESGFRRQTLLGQRELVRAVAHIPHRSQVHLKSIDTQSEWRVTGVARPRVDEGKSARGWHSPGLGPLVVSVQSNRHPLSQCVG
jgi:hypothetical protein